MGDEDRRHMPLRASAFFTRVGKSNRVGYHHIKVSHDTGVFGYRIFICRE